MDLSCSESTADISPAHTSDCKPPEDWHSMEYRVLSTEDAKEELKWLLSSELQANQFHALCAPSDLKRQSVVDTLCVVSLDRSCFMPESSCRVHQFGHHLSFCRSTRDLLPALILQTRVASRARQVFTADHASHLGTQDRLEGLSVRI